MNLPLNFKPELVKSISNLVKVIGKELKSVVNRTKEVLNFNSTSGRVIYMNLFIKPDKGE